VPVQVHRIQSWTRNSLTADGRLQVQPWLWSCSPEKALMASWASEALLMLVQGRGQMRMGWTRHLQLVQAR
jgi:hypothetical protein